jgi:hypothetical protein
LFRFALRFGELFLDFIELPLGGLAGFAGLVPVNVHHGRSRWSAAARLVGTARAAASLARGHVRLGRRRWRFHSRRGSWLRRGRLPARRQQFLQPGFELLDFRAQTGVFLTDHFQFA